MFDEKKSVFKEFWFQIIVIILLCINGAMFCFRSYYSEYFEYHCGDVSIYDLYLPSEKNACEYLMNNLNVEGGFMKDINDVAGRIMDKIDDEQNMHAFLLEEQSGLSSEELNFCYLKFENLSLLYPTPIYEYPHSVVDSLSCIMIYKKQKNKLFK